MYFPRELLHGDGGVFLGALGALSKHFKDLRTSSALSLPRASQWERCWTGIISSSKENNMIMDTFFSRFLGRKRRQRLTSGLVLYLWESNIWRLVATVVKETNGSQSYCKHKSASWYVGQLRETQEGLFFCSVKKWKELKWLEKKGNEGKERHVLSLEKEGSYIFKKQLPQRLGLCGESLCLTMEGKQGLLGPKCNVTSELETG